MKLPLVKEWMVGVHDELDARADVAVGAVHTAQAANAGDGGKDHAVSVTAVDGAGEPRCTDPVLVRQL